jgi:D-beta-D-heptose 7-phosphate kinase/D-beta-D-heptose 1-phosphate adenosyltransferase
MCDHYLFGKVERISPEAPVQVVEIESEKKLLGGAGNVINNLLSLGAKVSVGSVIGDDENGEWLKKRLGSKDINLDLLITEPGRHTSKKTRIISSNQQMIRFDKESKNDISKKSEEKLLSSLRDDYDLILLSDYAKGVLSDSLTKKIIAYASIKNIPVFVDPKGSDYSKYSGATLITPNKKEAELATAIKIKDDESLEKAGFMLKKMYDLKNVIITLSENGMAIFEENMSKIPTVAKEVYDVTGAGDTVLASLGYAVTKGKSLQEAAKFANYAAGVVVGKVGSATATLSEIEEYKKSLHQESTEDFIKDFKSIENLVNSLKEKNKKIIFTNGCFDILHVGHVKYLEVAKNMGDVLIVGLNSDESVKRLKGENRPVNPQADRAYLLAALECVDYVVIFEEDTPYELIKRVKPDILVKGGDYRYKNVVGSDIAKEVRFVDFIEGKSTTGIIEKIGNAK